MLPCWVARQVLGLYSWTTYWYLLPNRRSAIKRLTWQIASDSFAASSRHKVVLGLANHHYLRAAFIRAFGHSFSRAFIHSRQGTFICRLIVVTYRPSCFAKAKNSIERKICCLCDFPFGMLVYLAALLCNDDKVLLLARVVVVGQGCLAG